jgi:hypothetical protein
MTTKRNKKSRRCDHMPKIRVRWVRTPIAIPRGVPLRVLIYARFSTDEQRRRSIKAQVEFCERFLQSLGIRNYIITVIRDEALSGELRSRPGIDKVWAGIRERRWHLIVSEDSSRPYRDDVFCVELVRLAVDNGIRVLFINDYIDTAEPDWESRLKECAKHHASRNVYTSYQVKRAHDELWAMGAAICAVKTGYRRVRSDDDADAPGFDEIDPQWAPIIVAAYDRIAGGEPPWSVALWLTDVGLPKGPNCKSNVWTDRNVIALIRRTDYRGFQTHRDHFSKKEHSTGKHKPELNVADEVLTRQMEKLRIVDDSIWFAANDAIDRRAPIAEPPRGQDNPHYGIPRNSRGPLAVIIRCHCSDKMRPEAGSSNAYRCRLANAGGCWVKATSPRDKTHQWIAQPILVHLQSLGGRIDRLIEDATKLLEDGGMRAARKAQLEEARARLRDIQERLGQAIELATRPPEILVEKLEQCEDRLARIDAKLQRLQRQAKLCAPPTREEIAERLAVVVEAVQKFDRTSRNEIKSLVGTIQTVPCQQFGTPKVVLRARFEIRLAALLPARTRATIAELCDGRVHEQFERIPIVVDLFEPSTGPRYGLEALNLKEEENLTPTQISRRLGITKRKADIAVEYGRALRDAGLTDPFIEINEPPVNASRWRKRGEGAPRKKKQVGGA